MAKLEQAIAAATDTNGQGASLAAATTCFESKDKIRVPGRADRGNTAHEATG